jgi:hypothetical protein
MALVDNRYCDQCEAQRPHINNKCTYCLQRKRREDMAAWQAKTTDEKLLDLHKRMLRLEAGNTTY